MQDHQGYERPDFGHVGGQQVDDGFFEVIEDFAALFDAINNRGEVVVEQNHVGCVFGNVRPADPHGNADVALLDRWGIVDPIARYSHHVTDFLARFHDLQLLGWSGPCEHNLRFPHPSLQNLLTGLIAILERLDNHIAVDDNGIGLLQSLIRAIADLLEIFIGFEGDNADLFGNGGSSGRLVAGYHDDLDACRLALFDGEGDGFFGRVHEGY